jgi:type VI secretion system protein ImpE
MQAEQTLREGRLQDALVQLQDAVRDNPANAEYRVFLFQLLCLLGDWQRALTQLDVATELDAGTLAMAQTYREALRCEILRSEVFGGKRSPLAFGDPEPWLAMMIQALGLSAQGHQAEAQRLRAEAYETVPVSSGTVDGQPFEWIADADSRIGPCLETVVNGNYYWIPFHRIQRIQLEPPEDLRDMVWTPAQFTWSNGGQGVGLIPTRYSGSQLSEDSGIVMARKTEWRDEGEDEYQGLGQRMFATDSAEFSLMDVREIAMNSELAEGEQVHESAGAESPE